MRVSILFFFTFFQALACAQTISTIAGNGINVNNGDGLVATAASIDYPVGGAFDKFGNYYFGLGSSGGVRKISPSGLIYTVAGNGSIGYSGDGGPATAAELGNVQAVTVDTFGNLFIADAGNNVIRKIDVLTNIIRTVAGTGVGGYNGDDMPATSAQIFDPLDLCIDNKGNLYIAEYGNHRVRKISNSGIISTVAGNGITGYGGSGVAATSVSLAVWGICTDNFGNIYVADEYARVFKINSSGLITYFAGNGTDGYGGDGGLATLAETIPAYIKMDNFGDLFIVEYDLNRIRMVNSSGIINTISGNGISGYAGDGDAATGAEFHDPAGVAIDNCGDLYISDAMNYRIRKITYPICDYLSVSAINLGKSTTIYPNPVYDNLNIDNIKSASTYFLVNLVGKEIQQGTLLEGNNSIDIHAIANGMYLLEITDEEGRKTIRKIVKQ